MCLVIRVKDVDSPSLVRLRPSTLLAATFKDESALKDNFVLIVCRRISQCAENDSMNVLSTYLKECGRLTPAVGAVRLARAISSSPGGSPRSLGRPTAATTAGLSAKTATRRPAPA